MATKKKRTTTSKKTTASTKTVLSAPKSMPADLTVVSSSPVKAQQSNLFRWNKWLALLHTFQGLAVLVVGSSYKLPVTTDFLTPNPLSEGSVSLVIASRYLFDIDLLWLVASFFFMSALAHAVLAGIYRGRYEADLSQKINRLRWFEYAISASTMMVGIALLSGVYSASTLLAIFALTAVMNLMGLAMEVYNQSKREVRWLAFVVGCIAGIVPWLIVAFALFAAQVYGTGAIPGFVYWIYGSMFLLFSSFAANMYLQYTKKGKWADYLYGEKVYMVLSLTAKTALAWQIFAGTLRP